MEWEYNTESPVSGTTGDLNPFDIELRSCGEAGQGCADSGCGDTYLALCVREGGCIDSDGSYDVSVPNTVAPGNYVVSVTYIGSSGWSSAASYSTGGGGGSSSSGAGGVGASVTACSSAFSVEAATGDAAVVEEGVPALTATAVPSDLAPGEAFTAKWSYDDGNGEGSGTFEVNLYSCAYDACVNGRWVIDGVLDALDVGLLRYKSVCCCDCSCLYIVRLLLFAVVVIVTYLVPGTGYKI